MAEPESFNKQPAQPGAPMGPEGAGRLGTYGTNAPAQTGAGAVPWAQGAQPIQAPQGGPYGVPQQGGSGKKSKSAKKGKKVNQQKNVNASQASKKQQGKKGNNKKKRKKKRGPVFWISILFAIIAIIVAIILVLNMCTATNKRARSGQAGQLDGKTAAEIQAELDRVVEKGMFNISIAARTEFPDGNSEGELRIENVPNNPYFMQVTITRDDNGEVIYESGVIEQNYHVQKDKLKVNLPAGTYQCTATFAALDPETEQQVGTAAAQITIVVLS